MNMHSQIQAKAEWGTKVRIYLSPFDESVHEEFLYEDVKIIDLIPEDTREVFADGGVVRIDGTIVPISWWRYVTIKPYHTRHVDFIYVPKGKKTFLLLAAIALVAVTGFIGAGGVATLFGLGATSTFAAGGLGASLLAAGVGVAGSLALTALSAPPKVSNGSEDKSLAQAGIGGNLLTPLEPLPVVYGTVGLSPPLLAPSYTSWDGDNITAYGAVGVEGPCAIDDIRINGLPIDSYEDVEYEVLEGFPGIVSSRSMFQNTVIEERDGITLTNFITEMATNYNDILKNQDDPAESSPKWHYFRTAGNWTETILRFLFPSGIAYTPSGDVGFVALRIEIRKIGDVDWRRMPTLHVADQKAGAGPLRVEVRMRRQKKPGGRTIVWAHEDFPITVAYCYTGYGQAFAYQSDDYFCVPYSVGTTPMVTMTGPTTSGITITASSVNSTDAAWKIYDNDVSADTYWRPANNSLPAYLIIQLASPALIKSYLMASDAAGLDDDFYANTPDTAPIEWEVYGSTDGVTYVALDDSSIDISGFPMPLGYYQIGNPGSYTYYKFRFLQNNGAASGQLRINVLKLLYEDAAGVQTKGYNTEKYKGTTPVIPDLQYYMCVNCDLDARGALIYLDPDEWPEGEYEVRVKRSSARSHSELNINASYTYLGYVANADFFDTYITGGKVAIWVGQKNYRSDCTVEAFQTIDETISSFNDKNIACVMIAIKNLNISSLYARFRKYTREWDGSSWSNTYTLSNNPASHYRDLLLGASNAIPVAGECIDEDALAAWYEDCEANGYEVNAVLQSARVGDAKQMIATAGYASVSDGEMYGIVQDKDTSALPVMYMFTPQNSKDEGNVNDIPDLPHAIRAEFNDESQMYATEHTIIYRDGYSEESAELFETVNYTGMTNEAKVIARAEFDLKQKYMRQGIYTRRVGRSAIGIKRGDVVGLADPLLDGERSFGWIASVQTSGSGPSTMVTGITIDNLGQFSAGSSLEGITDLSTLTDLETPSQEMAVAIRIPGQAVRIEKVNETTNTNVITFQTPFLLAGSGIEENLMAVTGTYASTVRRCRVLYVVPDGFEERIFILVDEAPALFS